MSPFHGVPGLTRSALKALSFLQAGTELGSTLILPLFSSSACPRAFCEHPSNKVAMGTQLCLQ